MLYVPTLSLGEWITRNHACGRVGPGPVRRASGIPGVQPLQKCLVVLPTAAWGKGYRVQFHPLSMCSGCTNALKCHWMKGILWICGIKPLYSTAACVFTLGPEHLAPVSGANNLSVPVAACTANCHYPHSCLTVLAWGFSLITPPQMPVGGTFSSLIQPCLYKVLCLGKILQGNPKPDLYPTATLPDAHLVLQILLRQNIS